MLISKQVGVIKGLCASVRQILLWKLGQILCVPLGLFSQLYNGDTIPASQGGCVNEISKRYPQETLNTCSPPTIKLIQIAPLGRVWC